MVAHSLAFILIRGRRSILSWPRRDIKKGSRSLNAIYHDNFFTIEHGILNQRSPALVCQLYYDSKKVFSSLNLSLECPRGPYFGVLSLAFFLTSPPVMICDDALDLEFDEELGLLPPRAPDDVCCGGEVTNEVEGGL